MLCKGLILLLRQRSSSGSAEDFGNTVITMDEMLMRCLQDKSFPWLMTMVMNSRFESEVVEV